MAVIDVLGGTEQDVLDLQAKGHPGNASIDRRRLYISDGGFVRAIDVDGFDQFDVDQTIFSYRGAARKWVSGLGGRTDDNPAIFIWWGDSVTELMYGNPLYRFRERMARYNGGRVSPGWISAAPLSSDVLSFGGGGVNLLHTEAFRLSTGSYGASGGTQNIAIEAGLALYAFRLASGSVLTLYQDPNNDGTWTDQVVASLEWAKAHIHYTAYGTDASVGSLEVRVDGVLVATINGYDAGLAGGQLESGHVHLWDSADISRAHTITLTATGGIFDVEGIYFAHHDETVLVYNGGNAGEKYDDFLAVPSGHLLPPAYEVAASLQPHAVQLAYGLNDYGDAGGAQDLYDQIAESVSGVKLHGIDPSVGVLIPYASGARTDWPDYVVAAKDACSDSRACSIDTSWMLDGPASTSDPQDLVETEGGQHLHLSQAGGEVWADLVSRFWLCDNINWADVLAYTAQRLINDERSAEFTGSGFEAGLVVTKHDAGKAYLLLRDDKYPTAASTGLMGEISLTGRGATTLLGAGGLNGLVGFRFRAASTWTDTSAPGDIEFFNCAASSVTVAVRMTLLAGGGLKFPEMTPPAGAANNAIIAGRDVSGKTELGVVMPDSSFRPIVGDDYTNPHINPRITLQPTGWLATTVDRSSGTITNVATLTTQKLFLVSIELLAGMLVTNIIFHIGATQAAAPTNWWFALYDKNRALLGQTANQGTTGSGLNVPVSKALSSAYSVTVSDLYYLGIMFHGSTMPTLLCSSPNALVSSMAPILQGNTADTGLTTTAPNPAGAITSGNTRAYAGVS